MKDYRFSRKIEHDLNRWEGVEKKLLNLARESFSKKLVETNPLVSVTIPTFNRSKMLAERAISSVLAQTYGNFEIVVVGDHCSDDTATVIEGFGDPRIRFINLDRPSVYPVQPLFRWRVAGSVPINRALLEARGDWIAYLDDDDHMEPSRLEKSLAEAEQSGAEFVYGKIRLENRDRQWVELGDRQFPSGHRPFRPMGVAHTACLYRSYLKFALYDSQCWKLGLPVDRHWIYRLSRMGVKSSFFEEVVTIVALRD